MAVGFNPRDLPFTTFLEQEAVGVSEVAARDVFDCVVLAKRMLLEMTVQDFTGADVVALAALIEARDRHNKDAGIV